MPWNYALSVLCLGRHSYLPHSKYPKRVDKDGALIGFDRAFREVLIWSVILPKIIFVTSLSHLRRSLPLPFTARCKTKKFRFVQVFGRVQ